MTGCVKTCACGASMENTGVTCTPLMEVLKRLIMQPIFDSTGARNYIDLGTAITATTFTTAINIADKSKRMYPLPEMKDIKDTRGVPIVQTFPDGSTVRIRDDIRKFDGMIVGKPGNPIMKAKIEAALCGDMGVYGVDRLGNLIGVISDDNTKLYPIRLDSQSITASFIKATDTTIQALQVMFNFHPDESDACLRMVKASEMGTADLLTVKGLLNVYGTFTSPTVNGVVVDLFDEYGTPVTPNPVEGMVTADWLSSSTSTTSKVRRTNNTAADLSVVVTESTVKPGRYTLAYTTTAVGDTIIAAMKKTGYDFTNVNSQVITTA